MGHGDKMMWSSRFLFSLAFCIPAVFSNRVAEAAAPQDTAQQIKPSEAVTVSEFVAACDREVSLCEFKMRTAALNNINTRNSMPICFNDTHPQKRVIAWLKAHPETSKMPTEDGLYMAYKSLYPCP
jgi:hypothetical protein